MKYIRFSSIIGTSLIICFTVLSAWADNVITYKRATDGGLSVVNPSPLCLSQLQRPISTPIIKGECPPLSLTAQQAIEWIRDKNVPKNAIGTTIHDRSLLPNRKTTCRNGWVKVENIIIVDTTKC